MQTRRISDISMISAIVALILGFSASPALAQTSTCEDNGTVEVCVEWSDPVAGPVEGTNFFVTYHGSAGADVKLVTGDPEWRLWTTLVSGGAVTSFGDITLDPSGINEDFKVRIWGDGEAGAVDVGSLNLDGTIELTGWVGYSSIRRDVWSLISGDLNGVITLVEDEESTPVGGELGFLTIVGGVSGAITVPKVTGYTTIGGSVTGDILIGEHSSTLSICGAISGDLTVSKRISAGVLEVKGNIPSTSTVTITDITGLSRLTLSNGTATFDGHLDLVTGIPHASSTVIVANLVGQIDLTGDDVVGYLWVHASTTTGTIVNGGDVSGLVTLAYYYLKEFKGTATFASVPSGGRIDTLIYAELSGTLNVLNDVAGLIHILGSVNSGAKIHVRGSVSGDIQLYDTAGTVDIDNDLSGDVDIEGDLTGDVLVGGSLANSGFAGGGRILVSGESTGSIKVGKDTGSLTLIHVMEGIGTGATVEINTTRGAFDAAGDIMIGHPTVITAIVFDGCIRIYDDGSGGDGDLTGSIDVNGCHADGEVLVICIDGADNGNVTLDQTGCAPANATWGCWVPPNCP